MQVSFLLLIELLLFKGSLSIFYTYHNKRHELFSLVLTLNLYSASDYAMFVSVVQLLYSG